MKKLVGAIILAGFALAGCSTTTVTEKAQDKLCTGTKRPYQVKGTWHYPQDHYNYEEEGVASWYGPKFHGRPKSCGEIFNMHGISAAHKTLPIPSVVRVTNVKSGSSVKLLVDDRGPFIGDRIIDLSKGAATYLGMCNQGLGKVRVECMPEESKAFAKFVSQYGRYGRDPSGRSWETIFREKFDTDGCAPMPRSMGNIHHGKKTQRVGKQATTKRPFPVRKPSVRSISASDRSLREMQDEIDEREIDQLLQETRTTLGRKRV
ncbi:MAG: septal ring lytic transglycosylase RlpA family protein [Alphaproteobacteria bacterium]|jgi:rare lipoprotein A (peptidoglycan hydrolase)|nr:septal ring lytic transglycosylase RlpA family protein [Alphaproteobacteria bacterium]